MIRSLKIGVLGGVVGGIMFGIMMQMMGMIPMISMMVGSKSMAVGWGIHMIISIVFGAAFGYLATFTKRMFILSVIYGIMIWIVGPLVVMPLMLGMGTMLAHAFEPQQLMSLMTHLFFSFVLAATFKVANRKTVETDVNVTN